MVAIGYKTLCVRVLGAGLSGSAAVAECLLGSAALTCALTRLQALTSLAEAATAPITGLLARHGLLSVAHQALLPLLDSELDQAEACALAAEAPELQPPS